MGRTLQYTAEQTINSSSHSTRSDDLDLTPSVDELTKAIKQTNSGRVLGKDGIPAEVYKAAGPRDMEVFLDIIQCIWDQEKMPEDFSDALIVTLYRNKGSKSDCGNYRGISLLSLVGKIFAHIIMNRLIAVSDANLSEARCGVCPGCSTVEVGSREHGRGSMSASAMMGPSLTFGAKTKTLNGLIKEALFADDCTLMAHKPGDLQAMLNSFSDASKQFGLTISLGKTELLFQYAPNSVAPQPAISIDDVKVKVVDSFKYLGSMIFNDCSLDKEMDSRIGKAR